MPSTVKANNMKNDTNMKIETGMLITGIKLKCLSKKQNAYGENHMLQVLDEKQMNDIFKLAEENMKIPVWKYEDKCYLKLMKRKFINIQLISIMKPLTMELNKLKLKKILRILLT